MFSLSSQLGGGGVELGECIYMGNQRESLIEMDGMTFLKSGFQLKNEEANYPDVYAKYMVKGVRRADNIAWTKLTGAQNGLGTVSLVKCAYGNGTFVGLGNDGFSYTSADGLTWVKRTSIGNSGMGFDITFAMSVFVAVNGINVYRSADGITWTAITSATIAATRVTFVPLWSVFMIATATIVYRSFDAGLTWQQVQTGVANVSALNAYAGIVSYSYYSSQANNLYSTDGASWTSLGSFSAGTVINTILYTSNPSFTFIGNTNVGVLSAGNDSTTATARTITPALAANELLRTGFLYEGLAIVAGDQGVILASNDFINYTKLTLAGLTGSITSICTDGTRLLVTGPSGLAAVLTMTYDRYVGLPVATSQLYMRVK